MPTGTDVRDATLLPHGLHCQRAKPRVCPQAQDWPWLIHTLAEFCSPVSAWPQDKYQLTLASNVVDYTDGLMRMLGRYKIEFLVSTAHLQEHTMPQWCQLTIQAPHYCICSWTDIPLNIIHERNIIITKVNKRKDVTRDTDWF
jgi:hypothetical protein